MAGNVNTSALLNTRWYAKADDLVGGWCIMNVDKPPSQANHEAGEVELASLMDPYLAQYIVALHNEQLDLDELEAEEFY